MKLKLLLGVALLGLIGCRADEPAVSAQTTPVAMRGIVDSIFPVEEEIRRFKATHDLVGARDLAGGAPSREQLILNFAVALAARDTMRLRALAITAAEFIDLYYPTSIYSKPPYKQSPEVTWLLLQQTSEKGMRRAIERYGGNENRPHTHQCGNPSRLAGLNRFWDDCTVRLTTTHADHPIRIFGAIMERAGRFKFVSYANDL